jgi:hypothetical protein
VIEKLESVAREYSPRHLPSGWMHLTGGRPVYNNRSMTSVYGGFGMRVWAQLQPVETPKVLGWMFDVCVDKKSLLTVSDIELVMLGLFKSSRWGREVRSMWHTIEADQVGQRTWFGFASELIPADFSFLPGIRSSFAAS